MSAYDIAGGSNLARKRAWSFSNNPAALRFPAFTSPLIPPPLSTSDQIIRQISQTSAVLSPIESGSNAEPPLVSAASTTTHRARRASAAEKVLEQLRNRDVQKSGVSSGIHSPRNSWMSFSSQHRLEDSINGTPQQHQFPSQAGSATPATQSFAAPGTGSYSTTIGSATTATAASVATMRAAPIYGSPGKVGGVSGSGGRDSRRTSLILPPSNPPPSPVMPKVMLTPSRPRTLRSPSTPMLQQLNGVNSRPYPPELIPLLDGDHHTDEIGVRLNVGWPQLEEWLVALGGGQGDGDFGEHVVILYR
jgi:hypothetical protein